MEETVYVASVSPLKIAAAKAAVVDVSEHTAVVNCESFDIQPQSVGAQPVGSVQTIAAATERLTQLLERIQEDTEENQRTRLGEFAVAVENGIEQLTTGQWVDVAHAVVSWATTPPLAVFFAHGSSGYEPVPAEYTEQLEQLVAGKLDKNMTIGKLIAARTTPPVPHNDWNGRRAEQLQQAIAAALRQLLGI